MHTIWIPSLHRDLTGGVEQVQLEAGTVREVVEKLDALYPGIEERLCEDGNLRLHIAVAVNNEITHRKLRQKLREPSDIHFVPALSGG